MGVRFLVVLIFYCPTENCFMYILPQKYLLM